MDSCVRVFLRRTDEFAWRLNTVGPLAAYTLADFVGLALVSLLVCLSATTLVARTLPYVAAGGDWFAALDDQRVTGLLGSLMGAVFALALLPFAFLSLAISSARPLRDIAVRYVVISPRVAVAIGALASGILVQARIYVDPTPRAYLGLGLLSTLIVLYVVIALFIWFAMHLEQTSLVKRISWISFRQVREIRFWSRLQSLPFPLGKLAAYRVWLLTQTSQGTVAHLGELLEEAVSSGRTLDALGVLDQWSYSWTLQHETMFWHAERAVRAAIGRRDRQFVETLLDKVKDARLSYPALRAAAQRPYDDYQSFLSLLIRVHRFFIETDASTYSPYYRDLLWRWWGQAAGTGLTPSTDGHEADPYAYHRIDLIQFLKREIDIRPLTAERIELVRHFMRELPGLDELAPDGDKDLLRAYIEALVLSWLVEGRELQAVWSLLSTCTPFEKLASNREAARALDSHYRLLEDGGNLEHSVATACALEDYRTYRAYGKLRTLAREAFGYLPIGNWAPFEDGWFERDQAWLHAYRRAINWRLLT